MATTKEAVTSDTEGQEKPVRKQLQKASISKASGEGMETSTQPEGTVSDQHEEVESSDQPEVAENTKPTAELRKKRSFEEIEDDPTDDRPAAHTRSQQHTRKRSRDSTAEEDELNNGRKISGERKRDVLEPLTATQPNGAPETHVAERPGTPEQKGGKRGEEKVEAMTSPKTKRSRLHSATAEEASGVKQVLGEEGEDTVPEDVTLDEPPAAKTTEAQEDGADTKDPSDAKSPTIPLGSGFANTSTASPFGAVTSSKSPLADQPQTSSSAFAASGFGSLSGTATSGFGALGKTSGGPAGGWSSKPASGAASSEAQNGTETMTSTFGGAQGQKSAFGGTAGGSAFGSSGGSAFGSKLGGSSTFGGGSGFGSLGGAAGLSSFASGKASPFALGNAKPGRPFGAPVDEDEEEEGAGGEDDNEDDKSGLKSPLSQTSDKQDERFYIQDHETGEEGEVTEYSCRAKLYNFAVVGDEEKGKKEWKERGLGTVRLNTARPASDGEDDRAKARSKARLVMRADGSHRLILNTPVQKDIKFGAVGGGPPVGGLVLFMGAVDGKKSLEMLQLKIRQQFALELYEKIKELQEAM